MTRSKLRFQCCIEVKALHMAAGLPVKALPQISEHLSINSPRRARTQGWTLDVFFWQVWRPHCSDPSILAGRGCPEGGAVSWRCQTAFISS